MKNRLCLLLVCVAVLAVAVVQPVLAQATGSQTASDKLVNLNLKDAPIASAIDMLFQGSGLSYSVEPGVTGAVTVNLIGISFTDALSAVLKASGMTVRKENGVYMIGPQRAEAPETHPAEVTEEPDVERASKLEKIYIGYADVVDIGKFLGVQTLSSRASSFGQQGFGGSGSSGGMNSSNSGNRNGMSGSSGSSGFGSSGSSGFGSSGSSGSSGFGSSGIR